MKEYEVTNFLVSNKHIWWTKTEYFTTEKRFLLMLKMDVPRTLPSSRHFETIMKRFWNVSPKIQNYKTANSLVF